ncbi:MAG: iron-containing alcohol dehydrogenase [Bacteroidales bacterium]|nr:iron-containing alcohol dehydrogenase [Bacteroidales bacterium]
MDNFSFCTPTEYVFGRGVESQVGEYSVKYLGTKVLIVSGNNSAERSGLLNVVRQSLNARSIIYVELNGINPNPTDDKVYEGIKICREKGVTGVLAVGGGSVIDTAKAIAGGVPYAGDFWDFWSGKSVMVEALPIGTILTIAAAGSEGSGNSVITSLKTRQKISIRTNVLRPKFSLLNPELTMTLPPYQTACGIVDMMAHIMERYFSNTPDCEVTDRMCESLLTAIIASAPTVISDPENYQARANLMWAGTMAHNGVCGVGRAEDWTSHGMEHELSALYGVAHGAGLSVVFSAWLSYVSKFNPAKVEQFGRRVFGVHTAGEAINELKKFNSSIGMPVTLSELGIASPDIPLLVSNLHKTKGSIIGSYYPTNAEASYEIYQLML